VRARVEPALEEADEGRRGDDAQAGIDSVETGMRVLMALSSLGGSRTLTAIAAAAGLSPPRAHRYLVSLVALLMLVATVNVADKELLAPVADVVRAELGMSDTQLGAVRSAVFLAAMLGQFLWGPLSDRWVRKYVIAIGAV